jgi:hypothetical protein
MFLQINSNTYVRPEHISAVDFTQTAARVFVIGVPVPYRVMAADVLDQLHKLVQGEPNPKPQVTPVISEPQVPEKPVKTRRKGA